MQHIFNPQLPPYAYLMQVLNHNPKSASTYIELWRHKDDDSRVTVAEDELRSRFLMTPTKFKNDLMVLVREGLVSVDERGNAMTIELVDFDCEMD